MDNKCSKKKLNYLLNILFMLLITGGIFFIVLRKNDPRVIIREIMNADIRFLLIGAAFMALYICSESVIMRYLFKHLGQQVKLGSCLLLSQISFFYGAITPGASGGQPVQVFYMMKNGVNSLVGTLVAMVITLIFKFAFVLLNVVFLIINPELMLHAIGEVPVLYTYGFTVTFVFTFFLIVCIVNPKLASSWVYKLIEFGTRLKLVRHPERLLGKAMHSLRQYEKAAQLIKSNLRIAIIPIILTVIQRIFFFSIPWLVLKSLHLDMPLGDIISLQLVSSMAVDVLPLPGAAGASETVFVRMFKSVASREGVVSAMLLYRCITYYGVLIVGGIMSLIAHAYFVRKHSSIKNANVEKKRRRIHIQKKIGKISRG